MQEYFFANYRLLVDDEISAHDSMKYLSEFKKKMPYTHTFTLHLGEYEKLDEMFELSIGFPVVCTTEKFNIHDGGDCWYFASVINEYTAMYNSKHVIICSRDYSEMTVYLSNEKFYLERLNQWFMPSIPISHTIRAACEAGMVSRDGLPLHAALVEKDGCGVLFLGPSGMGKSTQAKRWVEFQNADFVSGDRPGLRCIDGIWCGCGMPWDGKDNLKNQKMVPIKALISLEQAEKNEIYKLNQQQAMVVLLNQAMMPMWDHDSMDEALGLMESVATALPFYHLKNLADREGTEITLQMISKMED